MLQIKVFVNHLVIIFVQTVGILYFIYIATYEIYTNFNKFWQKKNLKCQKITLNDLMCENKLKLNWNVEKYHYFLVDMCAAQK